MYIVSNSIGHGIGKSNSSNRGSYIYSCSYGYSYSSSNSDLVMIVETKIMEAHAVNAPSTSSLAGTSKETKNHILHDILLRLGNWPKSTPANRWVIHILCFSWLSPCRPVRKVALKGI